MLVLQCRKVLTLALIQVSDGDRAVYHGVRGAARNQLFTGRSPKVRFSAETYLHIVSFKGL